MKKILFAIAALAMTLTAGAQEATQRTDLNLSMSLDKGLVSGGEATLTVFQSDAGQKYAGFQMTPVFPDGVKIKTVYDEDEEADVAQLTINPNRINGQTLAVGKSVVCGGAKVFKTDASSDMLFTAILVADENYKGGGEISMTNIYFSDKNSKYFTNTMASIKADTPTAVVSVEENATPVAPAKYVENNQVVISKNNKKYNAAGAQIK